MGRRILFACAECDTALMWPVDAEPQPDQADVGEATWATCVDPDGREVVMLHPTSRWKAKLEPSGVVRCPEGHTVGVKVNGDDAASARLSLLRERVVARQMRGRV